MRLGGAITRITAYSALALATGWSSVCAAATLQFDIPAGPATQTLTRFAQQANLPIVVPYELAAGRRTKRIRGRMEPDRALQRLLEGTGLAVHRERGGQIIVTLATTGLPPQKEAREPAPVAPPAATEELAEAQVTGYRLDGTGMSTPTPVTVLSQEELESLSAATLAEALAELPQFLNNDTPQSQSFGTSAAAGSSHLNLRGIGSIRTLTLLDGRRVVPTTRFGTVDYALLPKALIQRVEIVTGGASAAYGSDAVSGVVNLNLNSSFQGTRLRLQHGLSEREDNANDELSLTWGHAIGENSHLTFAGEYYRAEGVRGYANRDWFHSWATIANPDPAGPPLITARDVRSTSYTYGGLITSGPLAGTQFLPGGIPAPFVRGSLATASTQSGGDGVDPAADYVWLQPDQQRLNGFLKLTTELSPGISAFTQIMAGHTSNTFNQAPPSLWGPLEVTIYSDNAFVPAEIRQRMSDLGLSSFRMGRLGGSDLASNLVTNSSNMLSITMGAGGKLGRWQIDSYYQFGKNDNLLRYTDTLRIDRIYRGIDSVVDPASGRIVCRSTLLFPDDGCVPVNLFGEGSVSPAAREYVTEGSYEQYQNATEHVAELTIQGDVTQLPAGRLQFASGINWRRESVQNFPRRIPAELESLTVLPAALLGYRGLPAAYAGSASIFERTVVNRVSGHYSVWEAFGEVAVPLLSDVPLAQSLTLHAAARGAHYSGSGTVPAWKGGLDWRLNTSTRLRLTRSRDVRAGSLSERFDTSNSGITIFDSAAPTPRSYAVEAVRTGNPQIDPEMADTWTGGIILTPSMAPGLSLSADYYDIRIHDAIALLGAQNIVTRCNNGLQEYCALVERSASTGLIVQVQNLVLNVVEARSRGVDLEFGWRRRLNILGGDESLAIRLLASRMLESSTTGVSGTKIDLNNQTGLSGGTPRWQANLSLAYWRGPLHVTLQQRLISSGLYNALLRPESIDDNSVPAARYTNLRASLDMRSPAGLTLFAHVTNLFDKNPPRAASWGFAGSIPTNETLFDVLGRRFVVGLTYRR